MAAGVTAADPAGTVVINLGSAGLTHARGKSDACGGAHPVSMLAVMEIDDPDLVDAGELGPVIQALHEQAHPDGCAYWENCRQPGCAEAYDLIMITEGK